MRTATVNTANMDSQSAGSMAAEPLSRESMSPGPLFVVGMWRSGTSLLYALLNQHPQIGLMYESDFALLSPLVCAAAQEFIVDSESRFLEWRADAPQNRRRRNSGKHGRIAQCISRRGGAVCPQKGRNGLGMQISQLLRLHEPACRLVSGGKVHRDLARSRGCLPQHRARSRKSPPGSRAPGWIYGRSSVIAA